MLRANLRGLLPAIAALVAIGGACSTPTSPYAVALPGDQPVVRALARSTVVRLGTPAGELPSGIDPAALSGWWREALRQSAWLDIAAGPVAAGPASSDDARLELAGIQHGTVFTATLVVGGDNLPLASVPLTGRTLPLAIDELALRVRLALGDPVDPPPQPVARIYSGDPVIVANCEAAIADARDGAFAAGLRRLQDVRRRDGGCVFLIESMASITSMLGGAADARRLADEALRAPERSSPTTTHRLLRTLLLARASLEPQLAADFDRELTTLALVAARERPGDPEVEFTACVALNFQNEFAAAAPRLRRLAARLPEHAGVSYHLGWAALGSGDAAAAVVAFDRATGALPLRTTVVPRVLARWASGDREGLRTLLGELAATPAIRDGSALHEIRRMQAALALLSGDADAAASHIAEDFAWLARHREQLETCAGDVADAATVATLLGRSAAIQPHLDALAAASPDSIVADAATYAAGLVDATARHGRATTAEAALDRRGRPFWSASLAAFGHRLAGELAAEQEALGRAAHSSSSPLVKAALVANLQALGRDVEAANLRAALRRELQVVELRQRCQSPILGPELAMAWLAGEPVSR